MTVLTDLQERLKDRDDVLDWARRFCDQFPWPESVASPPAVTFLASSRAAPPDSDYGECVPALLSSEIHERRRITLHLYAETLVGLPRPVLQGALDLELALHAMRMAPGGLKFNFSRSILPLMPVSGLGLQVLRHLVLQIEDGLKRKMATRQLVDGRHGPAQLVYLFHQIAPPAAEALAYRRMADHAWMRALFLSRKFKEYAAVDFVAAKNGAPALRQFWWDCNSYFSSRDQLALDKLARLSAETTENNYAHQIVEMFEIVKREFLLPLT
jgi:hypothetical protein